MLDEECVVWWTRTDNARTWHLQLLDDCERQRRSTLRRHDDRVRFTLGVALLRLAAGRHLEQPPAEVVVDRTCPTCSRPHGRPRFAAEGLFGSISHSGEWVAAALTRVGEVGVDVEQVLDIDISPLIDSVFSVDERRAVTSTADFYRQWTRKEAVLKATGDGLSRPMNEVLVSTAHDPPRLLSYGGRPNLGARLWDLSAGPGYSAALAVLGPEAAVVEHDAGPLLRGAQGDDQEAADAAAPSVRLDQARRP